LPIMAFWWAELPPKRRPFFGVPSMTSVLHPQGQTPLVELLEHLVERLLPEVGDVQQVVQRAVDQLADGVDLGPLEAVPGPLGEVQVLDAEIEVG